MQNKRKHPVRKFLEDVSVHIDGCWHWLGDFNKTNGYGVTYVTEPKMLAHRYMWEVTHEQVIPPEHVVMHTCDQPYCVNPEHLLLGTQEDNIRDMMAKGRNNQPKGVDHVHTKVTIELIRRAGKLRRNGFTTVEIASLLDVGVSTVSHMLVANSRYQHLLNQIEEEPGYGYGV
jgi:hypothetical protein